MSRLAPMLLERKLVPRPWGGRALERLFGLALPANETIGETWEVYDRPDGASRVRGATTTLADLMRDAREALLGRGVAAGYGGRFPLVAKLIDAADRLSVQVHPPHAVAAADGDGGKSEAWVVLHAGPRARIVRGLRAGVTRDELAAVAHTAAVEGLLHAFTPRAGDVIVVPPGTVHAIGPDVVVFEIQENSDLTYRLWDWGRPRETHVAQALGVVRFDATDDGLRRPVPTGDGGEWLVREPAFAVRRYTTSAPIRLATGDRVHLLTLLGGRARVRTDGAASVAVVPADTVVVPAAVGAVDVEPASGSVTVLWSGPGVG